jgi:predicted Rossmann fold flavoprotein
VRAYEDGRFLAKVRGDVIFTDYGVSGDAIFKISSYITEGASKGKIMLSIDLLPDVTEEKLQQAVEKKAKNGTRPFAELLCGILNNQVGRVVMKRAEKLSNVAKTVKNFELTVTGTLGFDYAQVTKGGIPLREVSESLESKYVKNLYFTGEILDVDGECGGYNLQWAYSSAKTVAQAINAKNGKGGGRV